MASLISNQHNVSGWWEQHDVVPEKGNQSLRNSILKVSQPVSIIDMNGETGVGLGGTTTLGRALPSSNGGYPLLAYVPALLPQNLGDPLFNQTYHLKYACMAGAMANGITSTEMVEEMAKAGMTGFFGSGGLSLEKIEAAIDRLQSNLKDLPFGFNLLHNPANPDLEMATVTLYLRKQVRLISASAYMKLTAPLVLFRVKGIHRNAAGEIVVPNQIFAKVSRVEIAKRFFSPPPAKILKKLREQDLITEAEAELASSIPVASALTAEADSGGHTDNRPALSLLPTMLAMRNEMMEKYQYPAPIFVGLGGGIATPESTAAAFAMGAAYVLTGSVNQSCVEAGTSSQVREMLAQASQADVTMAPAADMFEMGVKVQVLKRGTMFAQRAAKLYDLYRMYSCYEDIPEKERTVLEEKLFHTRFVQEWEQTRAFFAKRDPKQIERAEKDPRHKMALVFRSYLGRSSGWPIRGDVDRKMDYQIWCGPSMGAFNEWVRGSFLEKPENRKVATVAMNLLIGACVTTRASWLRAQGAILPPQAGHFAPMEPADIQKQFHARD
jgi:PfaD family protein